MGHCWLLKTEPGTYSYADLERDGRTAWDGVTNALALKHLRAMRGGDQVFIYHTGDEKQIVGIAKVVGDPYPPGADLKLVVVDIAPVKRLPRPVTLAEIKAQKQFEEFELVRISRLSVMPVRAAHWQALCRMAD